MWCLRAGILPDSTESVNAVTGDRESPKPLVLCADQLILAAAKEGNDMGSRSKRITVGMLKAMPGKWTVAANWRTFESQVRAHRSTRFDVIVTPECFLDGYAVTEKNWNVQRFARAAQDVRSSDYVRRVRNLAKSVKTNIVFGFTEKRDGDFYNAALVVNRKGEIAGTYYKTHLQNHDRRFRRGEDLPVFDLDIGAVGIVICADRR